MNYETALFRGFRPWVERQSGSYHYGNTDQCAFARYLLAQGADWVAVGGLSVDYRVGTRLFSRRFPLEVGDALVARPHTYEALAERLKGAGL